MSRVAAMGVCCAAALCCNPNTTRPPIHPMLGALTLELDLEVPAATVKVADALRADSIPVTKEEPRDGYLETPWFESATGALTSRRPLGPDVVRARAWIDPLAPGRSRVRVEVVFRPWADPSLPERELERVVPPTHPAAARVQAALLRLQGPPPVEQE